MDMSSLNPISLQSVSTDSTHCELYM